MSPQYPGSIPVRGTMISDKKSERLEMLLTQINIYKNLNDIPYEQKMRMFALAFETYVTESGYRRLAKLRSRQTCQW